MGVGFEEPQQVQEAAPVVHVDGGRINEARASIQKDREAAYAALEAYAKHGKGEARALPKLVQRAAWPEGINKLMPELATRAPGDIVLACAEAVGLGLVDSIRLAVDAKPAPSKAALARYLHPHGNVEVAALGADPELVTKLRAAMPGPMGIAVPQLADLPSLMHDRPALIKWYVETTAPGIAAIQFARQASSKELAATLDALDEWVWLDHLHIAANSAIGADLPVLEKNTKNDVAKAKLAGLVAKFTPDVQTRNDELRAARVALPGQLANQDDTALLDAAARTQKMSTAVDSSKVLARLRGESAEVVLQYLFATDHPVQTGVEAIAHAVGDRAQHLREYLRWRENAGLTDVLKQDMIRKQVRNILGRGTSLLELFEGLSVDTEHAKIAADEALRRWIYEDPDERAILWLAAAESAGAKQNCRLVASEHGNKWVKHLPASANPNHLRRFVLNSKDVVAIQFIKDNLLREAPQTIDAKESEVVAIDSATYGTGSKARLALETAKDGADPEEVLARLGDLTPSDRVEVLKDPTAVKRLLEDLYGHSLVRAMYLLGPTVGQLLAMPIVGTTPELLGYVGSRPDGEEVVAAASPKLIRAARTLFGFNSPVDVFPSLKQPANLAKALAGNDALLEWLLEETEPNYALSLLSRDPVGPIAARLMESRATLYTNLPAYDLLLPQGKQGFDALAKHITDDESRKQIQEYKAGDPELDANSDRRAGAFADAVETKDLTTAVLELLPHQNKAGMLALVRRAPAAQQMKLLDGKHREATNAVRTVTKLMPQQIFGDLSSAQLFALDGAARWILTSESPTVVLSLLAQDPAAIRSVGKRLDAENGTLGWIESLPRGAGLMAAERRTLDEMSTAVSSVSVLHALFRVRFDVEVQGFDVAETRRLWRVVERLPPAQLNQNAVRKIVEKDIEALGQWGKPDVELDNDPDRWTNQDHGYDEKQQLTLDQVKQLYGMTDHEVTIASQPKVGWLVEHAGKYTVKQVDIDQFQSTVLHEIGHSVDAMLGEHTELAYGMAGWKRYGVDQFETWASEMNGFDKLSTTDKPKVVDAWKQALRGNTTVKNLVDADHPALDPKYQGNPLVDAAIAGKRFHYTEDDKKVLGNRVCVSRGSQLFSLSTRGYQSAPSEYSLYAPEEYFAECYVEYYRMYDGTPKTEGNKGGRLAPWIKDWFGKSVDKIQLNPSRVRKTET